jgi:hypothetical protein
MNWLTALLVLAAVVGVGYELTESKRLEVRARRQRDRQNAL